MLFCPKCGTRNKTTYNYCRKCGTKIKYTIEDIKPIQNTINEYKINPFITLKLENEKTVIYVKDEKFLQCKYLLIEIPKDIIEDFDNFMSIDDVSEKLDHSLETEIKYNQLTPEIEFWGHCSNLQAWSENFYDTSLLHSNLAFPLLKKLTDVGDPKAKRVFKNEVAERLENLSTNVAHYLIQENYLDYFSNDELELLMEIFFEQIENEHKNKYRFILDDRESESLLNIIKVNLIHSYTFLINPIKHFENISKQTHMGFSYNERRVTALGFNRCGLKTIPSSIGNFRELKELYITENNLQYLPNSIGNLAALKVLNLSDNHLIELPDEIGDLLNLKELYLNHNLLQFLPESISRLKKVVTLSIWGNQIKNLPKNMNEMASLKVLGLSFNQLEEFPYNESGFTNLEILDLSNNKIKYIPENINISQSLKVLWLNNNPINFIPESILDLHSLKNLYIVNTPIAYEKEKKINQIFNSLEVKGINIWK
ncbi:MAG: leucine-rich repeat domain-containing protein [Candidatus Odinarchaeota archaeon]